MKEGLISGMIVGGILGASVGAIATGATHNMSKSKSSKMANNSKNMLKKTGRFMSDFADMLK